MKLFLLFIGKVIVTDAYYRPQAKFSKIVTKIQNDEVFN